MTFSGFPPETFAFLKKLAKNNSTAWFHGHKADYDAYVVGPTHAFIEAIGPKLKAESKFGKSVPQVNGAMFRPEQAGPDSSAPYKTSIDLWFWEGEKRSFSMPGCFMRLTATDLTIGAGMHRFPPVMLAAFRAAVMDSKAGATLVRLVNGLDELALSAPECATVPQGLEAGHRRADFLRRESLYAEVSMAHPKSVESARLVNYVLSRWTEGLPLCRWINDHVVATARAATH